MCTMGHESMMSAFDSVESSLGTIFFTLPVMCVWWVMCFQGFTILVGALYCVHLMPSNSKTSKYLAMCILATSFKVIM